MRKVVFSGYYGFDNAGDEAILEAMIRIFRKIDPKVQITVLSNEPEKTAGQYGVKTCNRWRPFRVVKTIAQSDLFISGGGSLLQDVTGFFSPLYYLGLILLAQLLGKPVMIYAQGIGPLKGRFIRLLTGWLVDKADKITVRDQGSLQELQNLGVTRKIVVTADPVLGLPLEERKEDGGRILLAPGGIKKEAGEKLLGVFIRPWRENEYLPELARALDILGKAGWRIVFVPMQYPRDQEVAQRAVRLMQEEALVLEGHLGTEEILSLMKNFDYIIGMRLHALIVGAMAGVPLGGLSYDPKVEGFLKQLGQFPVVALGDFRSQTLVDLVLLGDERREEIREEMAVKVAFLHHKAWQNARLAFELLPGGKIT